MSKTVCSSATANPPSPLDAFISEAFATADIAVRCVMELSLMVVDKLEYLFVINVRRLLSTSEIIQKTEVVQYDYRNCLH